MRIKYLFLFISWLIYGNLFTFAQDVLYVYKSDGDIISIQENQIDSIYCSNLIEDGKETSEIVSQVIQTKDSMYITLLCDIDSVGFHPQPMEVRDGVTFLDDGLMDYIIRVNYDSLYLVLSHETPEKLIPRNGEKLVTLKCTPIMGYAFAGIVNDVETTAEGIVVTCDDADLTEFFKTLYLTTVIGPDSDPLKNKANVKGIIEENRNIYQNKWTFDLLKDFGISYSNDDIPPLEISASNFSAEISHYTKVFQSLVINEGRSTQTIKVASNLHSGIDFSLAIKLQGELGPDQTPKVPLYGCPLANVYLSAGLYFKAEAEIAADLAFDYDASILVELNQDLKTKMVTTGMPKVVSHTKNPISCKKVLINGKLGAGLFAEIGIAAPYMKLSKLPKARAAIRDKVYYEVEGSYMIHNDDLPKAESDATMYDILRRTKIKQRVNGELDLILGNTTLNLLSPSFELSSIDLVPEFKFVSYKRNGSTRLWPAIHAQSNLLLDTKVDCIAKTTNGDIIPSTQETLERGKQDKDIELRLENIGTGKLQIYPRCTFMGITMLASPSQHVQTIDCDIQKIEDREARYSDIKSQNRFYITPIYNMPSYDLNEEYNEIRIQSDDEGWGIQYENDNYYWFNVPDGFEGLSLDYANYVAKLPINVCIIKWFKLDSSDKWSYLATNLYDHTCIYDEKPNVTISNVHVTGTSILEVIETDNVHYKTDYDYTKTWRGCFWMRAWQWETSDGWHFDTTGTPFTDFVYNDYYSDGTYENSSYTRWWSNGKKTHTQHMNIILRDGKEITSNYLYFNEGSIGTLSARSRVSSKATFGNSKAGIIVMNENVDLKRDNSIEEQVSNPERDEIVEKYLHK